MSVKHTGFDYLSVCRIKIALLSISVQATSMYSEGTYIVSPIATIGSGIFIFPEKLHSFPSVLRLNLRDIIQGPKVERRNE